MKNYIIDRITDQPCRNDIKENTEIVTLHFTTSRWKKTKIGFSSWGEWVDEMNTELCLDKWQNQNNRRNPNMKNTIVKITHETIKNTFDRIRNEKLIYNHIHSTNDGELTIKMPDFKGVWIDMDVEGWLKAHNCLPITIYDIDGKPVDIG